MDNIPEKVEQFVQRLRLCECTDIEVVPIARSGNFSVRCMLPVWYPAGTDNVQGRRRATWTFVVHNQKFQGEYKRPVADPDVIERTKSAYRAHNHTPLWWEL